MAKGNNSDCDMLEVEGAMSSRSGGLSGSTEMQDLASKMSPGLLSSVSAEELQSITEGAPKIVAGTSFLDERWQLHGMDESLSEEQARSMLLLYAPSLLEGRAITPDPEKGFSIYPCAVTIGENGEVLDPDGQVLDILSPDRNPNLIVALFAESRELSFPLENQTIDAAYKESELYNINDEEACPRLTDKDGNIIFMRSVDNDEGRPGSINSEEYKEELLSGVSRNTKNNDLSNRFLDEIDLSDRDLKGLEMRGVKSEQSNFAGSSFTDSHISGYLHGSSFENVTMDNVDIQGAKLDKISADGIKMKNVFANKDTDFKSASLGSAEIEGSNLDGAKMDNVNLHNGQVKRSSLSQVSLNNVNADFASFSSVNAVEIQAIGFGGELVNINDVDFSRSRMPGASFITPAGANGETRISESDFTDSAMPGSTFRGDYKPDTSSSYLDAFGPLAKNSNFNGTKQDYSSYSNCALENCTYRNAQFTGSTMDNVLFLGCDFKGADWAGVDVSEVEFRDAKNLDLSGAINADKATIKASQPQPLSHEEQHDMAAKRRKSASSTKEDPSKPGPMGRMSNNEWEANEARLRKEARAKDRAEAGYTPAGIKKMISKDERIATLKAICQRKPSASNKEIAQEMGVSQARVSQLRKEAGMPAKRGRPSKQSAPDDWSEFEKSVRKANEAEDWEAAKERSKSSGLTPEIEEIFGEDNIISSADPGGRERVNSLFDALGVTEASERLKKEDSSSPTGAMGRMKEGRSTPTLINKEKVSQERSEAAEKLSTMHGSDLKKKTKKRISKEDRIASLRAIHQRNPDASNAEIAKEMGVSSARVSQLRKEAGIPAKRGRPSKQSAPDDWSEFEKSVRKANEAADWRH